jgi:L-fuconolactonase
MRIDAHQHFWALGRGDYAWPTPGLRAIYRDFGPADLAPLLDEAGIDGTVLIQATPTLEETHFLLDLAAHHSFVKGVVGWVDFEAAEAPGIIADLARNPLLKGLRPMVQNIADDNWMLRDHLSPAFDAMVKAQLVFDALILPRHLPVLSRLISRRPALRAVIDHGAKPAIATNAFDTWAEDIARIARDTNVSCKLSGLWTEAGDDTGAKYIEPYIDHLLACFGPRRILWGSDWPVLALAGDYGDWHAQCRTFAAHYPTADQNAIFGDNARGLYGLD